MAENQNQQTDLTFPAEDFGLETAEPTHGALESRSKIIPRAAARGILNKLGGPIADIVTSQAAGEIPGEPPGVMSTQDKRYPSDLQRELLTASMMAEVPEGFSPLTVPENWEENLRLKLGRSDWGASKKPGEGVLKFPIGPLMGEPPEWEESEFGETAGAYKNESLLLQPKSGVNLPPLRIGRQNGQDFVNFIEGILSDDEIYQSGLWYRQGKMVEPFLQAVGPEKTPEMQAGAMLASQQKAPGPALGAYLRQLEQVKRKIPFEQRRKSGQQDQPLFELASGQPITRGAAQKIYDFFDSGEGSSTRTFYGNDPRAGKPFVVDTISFRNMGALDRAYWEWIQKNYQVPSKQTKDLSKYGYVSWDVNSDYSFDEEGNEIPGEPYALIERTEVYPQYRRKGYGKQLVRDAIREIQTEKPGMEIKLFPEAFDVGDTGLDDEQLWKWYESLGFAADESSEIGVMIYEGPDLSASRVTDQKLYLDTGGIVIDTPKGKKYVGANWDEAITDPVFEKALEAWDKEQAGKKIPKRLQGYKLPADPEQIRKGWGTRVGFAQYEFLGDEGRRITKELNAMDE